MKSVATKAAHQKLILLITLLSLLSGCSKVKVSEIRKEALLAGSMVLEDSESTQDPMVPRDPDSQTDSEGHPDPRKDAETPSTPDQPKFMFTCPDRMAANVFGNLMIKSSEVKIVFTQNGKSICEVPKVRSQLVSKKTVDVSSCLPSIKGLKTQLLVVDESVTSDFSRKSFNIRFSNTMFRADSEEQEPYDILFTEDTDKANRALCDEIGDPLLIQLNASTPQPIELTAPEHGVMFDLLGRKQNHQKVRTSWFANNKSENYFLVLPNAKGQVLGINELFGDSTLGPDQKYAKQGFAALAKHDLNRDRMIDSEDAVFSKLALWKDSNLDGVAQAEELSSLDQKGVLTIDLRYDKKYLERDRHGNMTKFKSVVVMKDDSYSLIYDLWLRYQSQ